MAASRRSRAPEVLDDPATDPYLAARSLRDVAVANRLFGGSSAVLAEVMATFPRLGARATLLDVGTGMGDIPALARAAAARAGIALETIGLEASFGLALGSRPSTTSAVVGDGRSLPFADQSVDIVTCSQVLHHFFDGDARQLVRELHRVARLRVIISELRRSRLAAAGIWLASFALGFHPVSRHDGVVSVMRGFTTGELSETVRDATGATAAVRRRLAFRVTASWTPPVGRTLTDTPAA